MTHEQLAAIPEAIDILRDMVAQATKLTSEGYMYQHVKVATVRKGIAVLAELDGDES